MAFCLNRGEWAEVYVLFSVLADGVLNIGDPSLSYVASRLPLNRIERQDKNGIEFVYTVDGSDISITGPRGFSLRVARAEFRRAANDLKDEIQSAVSSPFSVSSKIESFLTKIKIDNPKAKSVSATSSGFGGKCDIRLTYTEPTSGFSVNTGFSIKSSFSSPATLMNYSAASKFPAELYGCTDDLMMMVNSIRKSNGHVDLLSRGQALITNGVTPKISLPIRIHGRSTFEENLRLVNSDLVSVIAECLYCVFFGSLPQGKITELADYLSIHGKFASGGYPKNFYHIVLKDFLFAVFGGMTPAKPWSGHISANGGFIIVKPSFDTIVALSSLAEDFKDYLFLNTRFDKPDTKKEKADYGYVYKIRGSYYMDLNFIIRFLK